MALSDWDVIPGNNGTKPGINWEEGMPPSAVNNSGRQMMSDIVETSANGGLQNHWLTQVATDGTITVTKGASGASAGSTAGIILEDNATNSLQFLVPDANISAIDFGAPLGNSRGHIKYFHSGSSLPDTMVIKSLENIYLRSGAGSINRLGVLDGGEIKISSELVTGNSNMTVGLTIDQRGNDNEILALKSSDIAHGYTNLTETDTYSFVEKIDGAEGGARITGLGKGTELGLALEGYADFGNVTKTSVGRGHVEIKCFRTLTGSMGIIDQAAGVNLCAWRTQLSGTEVTVALVDSDGQFFADVTTIGALDHYEDVALCRAIEFETDHPESIIPLEWDDFAREHKGTLRELGIIGDDSEGGKPLTNMNMLLKLHNGALVQGEEKYRKLRSRFDDEQEKNRSLESRLDRLERMLPAS